MAKKWRTNLTDGRRVQCCKTLPGIHHVSQDIEIKRWFPKGKDHLIVRDNQEARIISWYYFVFLLPPIYCTCTFKSVLHILRLVYWAPTQYQNKLRLWTKAHSHFNKIMYDQRTRNKIKHFSGPVKVRALKNETAKQQPSALLRGQQRAGLGGKKNTPSSASQRMTRKQITVHVQ